MKDKKKKGPSSRNHPDPLRKADAKRFLHSKGVGTESPESKIIVGFLESYPSLSTTIAGLEMLWSFLTWLKEKGYHVIDERDVFCLPFSHLVRYKGLK